MSVRILIANDRPEVRQLLRGFVEKDARWEVCGEAVDGVDAVSKAQQLVPELIILDLGMPVMNGIKAAREITKFLPETMLLLCANHLTRQQRNQAVDAGIRGVIAKTRLVEVLEAVAALLRNETFFGRKTMQRPHARWSPNRKNKLILPASEVLEGRATLQSSMVPQKIFFCEAVRDGSLPTQHGLLPDPDPLVCTQCTRSYNLHYSRLVRPVLAHLSRLLTTDVIESEHPRHSARLSLEIVPSNAVN